MKSVSSTGQTIRKRKLGPWWQRNALKTSDNRYELSCEALANMIRSIQSDRCIKELKQPLVSQLKIVYFTTKQEIDPIWKRFRNRIENVVNWIESLGHITQKIRKELGQYWLHRTDRISDKPKNSIRTVERESSKTGLNSGQVPLTSTA